MARDRVVSFFLKITLVSTEIVIVPRISRVQRMIAFFPEPIPRLPIPRYLVNGLFALIGRTLTPVLSSSNSSTSPARTPSDLRMARGTVIRPFDVIFALFLQAPSLPIPLFQRFFSAPPSLSVVRFWFALSDQRHPRKSVVVFSALRCSLFRHQHPVVNPQQQRGQHADGDHRPPHLFRLVCNLAKVMDQLSSKPSSNQ